MTHSAEQESALRDLIDAFCEGELNAEAMDRLESLLLTDDDACRYYLSYVKLHGLMILGSRPTPLAVSVPREDSEQVASVPLALPVSGEDGAYGTGGAGGTHSPIPTFVSPGPFVGAWRGTGEFLSTHEWFTSYLTATVLFGIAALIFSNVYITHPQKTEFASNEGRPAQTMVHPDPDPEPEIVSIARITGKVDCRWVDKSQAPAHDKIKLHDKFALTSGLMEITYHTGAKVILQGPCTYEVESASGGYLSLGKLTARAEKKVERGEGRGESESTGKASGTLATSHQPLATNSSPQPLAPSASAVPSPLSPLPSPLFAVRTPTAVVTDLGTEFGVEVDAAGITQAKVFQGKVVFVAMADGRTQGRAVELGANQSALVERTNGDNEKMTVVVLKDKDVNPIKFVRNIHYIPKTSYGKAVLEDRPFAYWPLNEAANVSYVADRSGNKHHGVVHGKLGFGQPGPLAGEQSRSVEFDGKSYIEVDPPLRNDPAKGFSIEAWARVGGMKPRNWWYTIVANIDWRDIPRRGASYGYVLYDGEGDSWQFRTGNLLGTRQDILAESGIVAVKETWTHLVATFEPTDAAADDALGGIKKLYLNGELIISRQQPKGYAPNEFRPFRIGANSSQSYTPTYFFVGNLAEIAIYDRSLPEDRVKAHWEAAGREEAMDKQTIGNDKPLAASH